MRFRPPLGTWRGRGLEDIRQELWGYNNSGHYGRAVLHYAALMEQDEHALLGLYHWEIHFASALGGVWLPVGYAKPAPIAAEAYLRDRPASAPPELYASAPEMDAVDAQRPDQSF